MSRSVVCCYAQPGKDKSLRILEAFAAGCGGSMQQTLRPGAAAFYGVVGLERTFAEARGDGRDWYYLDNAYVDAARGTHYRVGRNELQAARMLRPDFDRLGALNLEIKPWRRDGRHVVVAAQSDHFMQHVANWPRGGPAWLEHVLRALKRATDRLIVVRHWSSNKLERARSLRHDLDGAWALVTHMSAAANEAVLAGVPVFVTGPCAALPMGLSDLSAIERPRRPDGRHEWVAGLAGAMWTLEEMRMGVAWRALS